MKRIAVIGAGIAGMAAAYYLSRRHETWLFEKEDRLGGHTHTHKVRSSRGPLAVDTGFIVHNPRMYPNLVRLFDELGMKTQASDMSFSVSDRASGFEYSSRGATGFFAQFINLFRPSHYKLLAEMMRFSREGRELMSSGHREELTLKQFLDEQKFSITFAEKYLYPMAASVWSTSFAMVDSFPALTLLRFFDNHGMLDIFETPKWRTVKGGSSQYIAPLTRPFHDRVITGAQISAVERHAAGVRIKFKNLAPMEFDEVVFACHGNQVLPLLAVPSRQEQEIFSAFSTTANDTVLHTDGKLLPKRGAARASWNYHLSCNASGHAHGHGHNRLAFGQTLSNRHRAAALTYHMNRLQALPGPEDYCVTLNANGNVDKSKVLRRMTYFHPLFTLEAVRAQSRWAEISGRNRAHFCGAYWMYGFHEDGLNSALRVAQALGVEC